LEVDTVQAAVIEKLPQSVIGMSFLSRLKAFEMRKRALTITCEVEKNARRHSRDEPDALWPERPMGRAAFRRCIPPDQSCDDV